MPAPSSEDSEAAAQPPKKPVAPTAPRRPSDGGHKKTARSASSDSSSSAESSSSSAVRSTGAPFTTEEVKRKFLARSEAPPAPEAPPKQFQSRFLSKPAPTKEDESETSSEEETESEEESDEPSSKKSEEKMARSDIGALLARSAHARDPGKAEEAPVSRSKYAGGDTAGAAEEEDPPPRYPTEEDPKYPTGRSRYMALKERRQRLARSRSSQQFGDEEEPEESAPISPTTSNPSAYLASRGYTTAASQSAHDLARSRSTHALKETSPDRAAEKDGAALSSWARYLKNKYGGRGGAKDKEGGAAAPSASGSTSAAARRLSLGLPLRSSTELASSDDDQKNMQGSPTTHTVATAAAAGFAALCANSVSLSCTPHSVRKLWARSPKSSSMEAEIPDATQRFVDFASMAWADFLRHFELGPHLATPNETLEPDLATSLSKTKRHQPSAIQALHRPSPGEHLGKWGNSIQNALIFGRNLSRVLLQPSTAEPCGLLIWIGEVPGLNPGFFAAVPMALGIFWGPLNLGSRCESLQLGQDAWAINFSGTQLDSAKPVSALDGG
ncbi:hypothetical protein HUJ05_010998 [Dendroctonus ponderosae]|nr:hypothetical protein HUJ05_010998 [Dendroctonus ponderosae]